MGTDGRCYIVDAARLFPPEPPVKKLKGAVLYRLLRPELIKKSSSPISSDAFTLWGGNDPVLNRQVKQTNFFLFLKKFEIET